MPNLNFDKNLNRDKERRQQTGEVFTPSNFVKSMIDKITVEKFTSLNEAFLDPTCGNGQFLVEIKRRLLLNPDNNERNILENQIFGVDLMLDNAKLCIFRLCVDLDAEVIPGYEDDWASAPASVVNPNNYKLNICVADGTKYDYGFVRFDKDIHNSESCSEDGSFYLKYNDSGLNLSLFDW